jgi:hypothetical protein
MGISRPRLVAHNSSRFNDIIHHEEASLFAPQNGRHQILSLPTVRDCCFHAEKYSWLCRGGAVLGTGGRGRPSDAVIV